MTLRQYYILLVALPLFSFSQTASISGLIMESSELPFPGVTITLVKNGESVASTQTDFDGNYVFKNIDYGMYEVKIQYVTMTENTIPNFEVKSDTYFFNYIYPAPCKLAKRFCPKGHGNNIIPIVYGFPSKKMMRRANRDKIKLGGCDPSPCESWHCQIHDIDFKYHQALSLIRASRL